jgi:hypothetical protein
LLETRVGQAGLQFFLGGKLQHGHEQRARPVVVERIVGAAAHRPVQIDGAQSGQRHPGRRGVPIRPGLDGGLLTLIAGAGYLIDKIRHGPSPLRFDP